MNKKKFARKLLESGFNIVPTNSHKIAIMAWTKFQTQPMTLETFDSIWEESYNIGVLTGGSSRVVCLDADMKYDLSGDLWDRFKAQIPNKILKKMYVQATKNNGFHFIFKTPSECLRGNEKLAARPTTADEKHQTYIESFQDTETKDFALKTAINDSSRILFETRGGTADKCGGYFVIAPSEGYTHIYGKIQEVTVEEYELIMETARSFNQVKTLHKDLKTEKYRHDWEVSPFAHFDQEGDVVSLLQESGWKALPQKGKDIKFLRPGKTHAAHSGILDTNTRVFNCYSTSTCFEVGHGYLPSTVFTLLECNNDAQEAYKKLVTLGFGIKCN